MTYAGKKKVERDIDKAVAHADREEARKQPAGPWRYLRGFGWYRVPRGK